MNKKMMTNKQIELCSFVEKQEERILAAERWIAAHPETGFQEWQTSAYMAKQFESMGYVLTKPDGIPGFFADIETGRAGPKIIVFSELDALPCANHLEAVDGIAHACGHNAQCAAMLGLAGALKEQGVLDELCGSIRLIVVPAEEMIQTEYREKLCQEKITSCYSGKPEYMKRGFLDGADMAFMIHTASDAAHMFSCNTGHNGFILKTAEYKGHTAHAGSSPDKGINALYAANLGLSAINALRETFRDEDHIRVHPILSVDHASVNSIPDSAKLEMYIRGADIEAILEASRKVNRALAGAALAIGSGLNITDRAGYAPLRNDTGLMTVAKECMSALAGKEKVNFKNFWSRGSTDLGDVSSIMPAAHLYVSGATGVAHGADFCIANPMIACVDSAKAQLLILHDLLKDNAVKAHKIKEKYVPIYETKEDYFKAMARLNMDWEMKTAQGDSGELKVMFSSVERGRDK